MEKEYKKGIYLISGPTSLKLISGKVESIGKHILINEKIFIPEGKKIPIEIKENSLLEIDNENLFVPLQTSTIPKDWDEVVEYLITKKINTLIIFGEVDTGKTFFSTYLTNKLIAYNIKVSVLDCDTGQSDIGPPGCLGLAVFKKPILFMAEAEPSKLYFVGSHSPSEHFLYYISGFVKLIKYGIDNSDIVIIDTPGWVLGDGGRMLRKTEIEILSALDLNYAVVLLERTNEIEHLVKDLAKDKVIRLTVSKKASPTSAADRKKLREFMYKRYFSNLANTEFSFDQIKTDRVYFLTGERIDFKRSSNILWVEKLSGFEGIYVVSEKALSEKEIEVLKKTYNVNKVKNPTKNDFLNTIVGLLDINRELICLGLLNEIDFRKKVISILYPNNFNVKNVKILQFGSLKLSKEAKEYGFVEPGIL